MRTPDFVLIHQVDETLPAGSFVRPIRKEYLPRGWEEYVKDARWIRDDQIVCYTCVGLRVIQKDNIRQC